MTTLNIAPFGGMVPRLAPQRLPLIGSDEAINCDLLSGDLRALRGTLLAFTFSEQYTPKAAFRIPAALQGIPGAPPANEDSIDDVWVPFEQEFTHFLKGPLVNDAYDRWYWTEEGQPPRYNTLTRIKNGDPAYRLGVPRPVNPPSVSPSGGTDSLQLTRCYTYTFVSEFGEEGPPADPTCAEGNEDGTWTIGSMDTAPAAPFDTEGSITRKRIYRTVTGSGGFNAGSFFFVDEINIADVSYVDTILTDEIALNKQLESDNWDPPPADLVGIVRHPNGFFVGFSGSNNLYFSVPYRPHAWPAEFVLSTEGGIQALGVYGVTVVVTTNAHPYAVSGITPSAMAMAKNNVSKPCLSRYGVVSSEAGVIYPSPDGLSMVGSGGLSLLTEAIVTREQWNTRYFPQYLRAARFGFQYLGIPIGAPTQAEGFIFAPQEANSVFTEVDTFAQQNASSVRTDPYSGQIILLRGQNVEWWADYDALPEVYSWKSPEFVTSKPINFGAFRIDFDPFITYPGQKFIANVDPAPYIEWNQYRFDAGPLRTVASHVIGKRVRVTMPPAAPDLDSGKMPLAGSALYNISQFITSYVEVELWGKRRLRYKKRISTAGRFKLPAGYKTDIWQVRITGTANVHHFKMAETGLELERV